MLSTNFGGYKSRVSLMTIATLGLIFGDRNVKAEIAEDSTTNTQVQTIKNTSLIKGGTQNGSNLFHSFKQFSLATDEVANFSHNLNVENIFSRVTGGLVSELDGLIQTQGDANLFLLNPAGIVFGANARLDIGGSFIVSTGDRFLFEDGAEFGTANFNKNPLLTISSPIGLQYGANPGEIAVLPNNMRLSSASSGLTINPGQTLALLGGDVSITRNSLNGAGSNIEIGSIKAGRVDLSKDFNGWKFDYANVTQLGQIDLSNRALIVNNSGVSNFYGAAINLSAGSGIINFISLDRTESLINLEATETISLSNSSLLSQVWQQRSNIKQDNTGAGGDIYLQAAKISFSDGSLVSAATLGEKIGGSITIDGGETLEILGSGGENPTIISTSTEGSGNGGDIEVNTARFTIEDGSQIQAFGKEGAGGKITVNASESINISGTGIVRSQDINTGNLLETILASGFSASAGIEGIPLAQQPQGNSGNLLINTPQLNLADQGQISVGNFGLGNGGDIQIFSTDINLNNEGTIIANTVSGNGGSIAIHSTDSIILDGQSAISTTAANHGDGGKINLKTSSLVLLDANKIIADAQQGSGGKITIDTQVLLTDLDSKITADSQVNQKKGVVKIETLDLNSRLQTKHQEQDSLTAENYIQQSCGVGENLANNQFRNVGRGGMANNPLQAMTTLETLGDLDNTQPKTSATTKQTTSKINDLAIAKRQIITEAQAWIINKRGKVELISAGSNNVRQQQSKCRTH